MAKRSAKLVRDPGRPLKPIELAASWYDDPARFVEWHRQHLLAGYVFSTPKVFVMGRAVDRFDEERHILDPMWIYPPERENAWFIYLVGGDWREAMRFLPYPLPWVGWEREPRRGLRWMPLERLKNKLDL